MQKIVAGGVSKVQAPTSGSHTMFCTEESENEMQQDHLEKRDSLVMAESPLEPKQLVLSRGNSIVSEASYRSIAAAQDQNGRKSFAGGVLLPEKEIWRIFADMARALKHVHDKGFVHLDIKPSNFFVAKDRKVKLGDFGLAIDLTKLDTMIDDD